MATAGWGNLVSESQEAWSFPQQESVFLKKGLGTNGESGEDGL